METFKSFFKALTPAQKREFAARCKTKGEPTSAAHLTNIANGHKPCGESLAIEIERESGGLVRCEDLRPDVDWAVLRSSGIDRRAA